MYKPSKRIKSKLGRKEIIEGETIEDKVERIMLNKEPIKDGAPEIYTERKDGVLAAYNIRTDRWEIAASAMEAAEGSKIAKAEKRAEAKAAREAAKVEKATDGEGTQSE